MTTVLGGLPGTVALLPLSGFVAAPSGISVVGGVIDLTTLAAPQPFPVATTLSSMTATFVTSAAMALLGSTVQVSATLYQVPAGTMLATAVPGFTCLLAPALSGVVAIGNISTCSLTGASATFNPGDGGIIVFSVNVVGGVDIATTVAGSIAAGLG